MSESQYDQETFREVASLVKRAWPTRASETESFTEDQMIEAWKKGLADAFRLYNDTMKRVLEENIKHVAAIRDSLVSFIHQQGLTANKIYLNVGAYDTLRILIALPETDYCSERFLQVLGEAARLEHNAHDEITLNLSIEFMPDSEDLDEEQLLSDGYIWPQVLTTA